MARQKGFSQRAKAPSKAARSATKPRATAPPAVPRDGEEPLPAALQAVVNQHLAGDLEAAEAGYHSWIETQGDHSVVWCNLGAISLRRQHFAEALAHLERSLALNPTYAVSLFNRGNALRLSGALAQAEQVYRQLLTHHPSHVEGAINLALCCYLQGHKAEAVAVYQPLLQRLLAAGEAGRQPAQLASIASSLGVALADLGQSEPAIAAHHQAVALNPTDAAVHFNLAVALAAAGRAAEAIASCRRAVALDPGHVGAWLTLSAWWRVAGEPKLAAAAAERGLALQPASVDLLRNLSVLWAELGEPRLALKFHARLAAALPEDLQVAFDLAIRRAACGDGAGAELAYHQLLDQQPQHAAALSNLAVLRLAAGDPAEAEALLRRALAEAPAFLDARYNLGVALAAQGRQEEAEEVYRAVLAVDADHPKSLVNLGALLNQRGDYSASVQPLRRAVAVAPAFPEALLNLATAEGELGEIVEAEALLRRALAERPTYAEAWFILGNVLHHSGQAAEAVEAYASCLRLAPRHAMAHTNRGVKLGDLGRHVEAVESHRASLDLDSSNVTAWYNLGNSLHKLQRNEEALQAFAKTLELDPQFYRAEANQAVALQDLGRLDEAEAAYRRSIALHEPFADHHYNLGVLLKERGVFEEGARCYRRAIELKPDFATALSNLVYLLSFSQIETPESTLAATRDWVRVFCETTLPPFQQRSIPLDRPLRLGVISAELGSHAVAYFLRSYLAHHDPACTRVHLYSTVERTEPQHAEVLALAEAHTSLVGLDDASARELILADEIDILIDTTSHMRGNRLPLLAQRCAPVQCHWIGFHGSTGVPAIDWFIGDEEVTPPAQAHHFSEGIWRLPRLWVCYQPPEGAPAPAPRPIDGQIRFGSFNNLLKVGPASVELFARVLQAVPNSVLVLKDVRCADAFMRGRIERQLQEAGIAAERLQLVERVADWNAHMNLYNEIDIALDTTPLNSGTTGFDALFMGTPLVALRGNWIGGRLTSARLTALGRAEWIAEDQERFVAIARHLAADPAALRQLRTTLRSQVLASPLCDGADMGLMFDRSLNHMALHHNSNRCIDAH